MDRARRAAKAAAQLTTAPETLATPDATASDVDTLVAIVQDAFISGTARTTKAEEIGLPDAVAKLEAARQAAFADPTPENHEAVLTARNAVRNLRDVLVDWEDSRASQSDGEQALTALGHIVASRAEEIAGITAEGARVHYDTRLADALAQEEQLTALANARATELGLESLNDAFNAARAQRNASVGTDGRDAAEQALTLAADAYSTAYKAHRQYCDDIGLDAARSHAREVADGRDEVTRDHLQRLAEGYRQAVSERRPTGGALRLDAASKNEAAAIFNAAAQVYPTDWIDASNAAPAPWARVLSQRAHYASSRTITAKKRELVTMSYVGRADEDPYKELGFDRRTAEIVPHPDSPEPRGGRIEWLITEYEPFNEMHHRRTASGKPSGGGWEEVTYTSYTGEDVTTWRRAKYTMRTVERRSAPEITTPSDYSLIGAPGGETATHELAHRMEAVIPSIGRMEGAFLDRRTTRSDGTRAPLFDLYGTSKEQAREGGFVDPYIGKEYGDGRHFEVMSVGAESLFHGEFGGLAGLKKGTPPDLDHRAFVLGVMVTAQR